MSAARDDDEPHRRLVLRLIHEVVNTGDMRAVTEIVHRDFFSHDAPPSRAHGPEGLRRTVDALRVVFAGYRIEAKDVITSADKVVVRVTASGRHVGELNGASPTGREWSAQQIHIFRLADGQIIEHWASRDDVAALRRLANPLDALPRGSLREALDSL